MRKGYLSHRPLAKVQESLPISPVLTETCCLQTCSRDLQEVSGKRGMSVAPVVTFRKFQAKKACL